MNANDKPKQLTLPTPRGISPARAAKMLGVSDQTVRRYIDAGRLRAYRWRRGGNWKITMESIEEMVERSQRQIAQEEPPE